jgi:hypothetical protein
LIDFSPNKRELLLIFPTKFPCPFGNITIILQLVASSFISTTLLLYSYFSFTNLLSVIIIIIVTVIIMNQQHQQRRQQQQQQQQQKQQRHFLEDNLDAIVGQILDTTERNAFYPQNNTCSLFEKDNMVVAGYPVCMVPFPDPIRCVTTKQSSLQPMLSQQQPPPQQQPQQQQLSSINSTTSSSFADNPLLSPSCTLPSLFPKPLGKPSMMRRVTPESSESSESNTSNVIDVVVPFSNCNTGKTLEKLFPKTTATTDGIEDSDYFNFSLIPPPPQPHLPPSSPTMSTDGSISSDIFDDCGDVEDIHHQQQQQQHSLSTSMNTTTTTTTSSTTTSTTSREEGRYFVVDPIELLNDDQTDQQQDDIFSTLPLPSKKEYVLSNTGPVASSIIPIPVTSVVVSSPATAAAFAGTAATIVGSSFSKARPHRYQNGPWNQRLEDLQQFRQEHGHMLVPHLYPKNPNLSQWVKRQRYQYRLKKMGRHSTLSDDREYILNQMGFVWESHKQSWNESFLTLRAFYMTHGHCRVTKTNADETLNTWCKHQRRQYKRFVSRQSSHMTPERIRALESLHFDWDPWNLLPGLPSRKEKITYIATKHTQHQHTHTYIHTPPVVYYSL